MKRFIAVRVIILSAVGLILSSCNPGACFEETESYLKATLYLKETGKATAPEKLSLIGAGQSSIIYDDKSGVSVALIPLNSSAEISRFIITINKVADTIEFHYSSYPHLISKECGYTFYHHLEADPVYTNKAISTVTVSNNTITNLNVENIRIYY